MSTLKVDTIADSAGTGAPDFSNGLKLSGGTAAMDAYLTETKACDGAITGNMRFTKIGNLVVITSNGALSHASGTTAATNSGWVPASYRPTTNVFTIISMSIGAGSDYICRALVASDGTMTLAYGSETFATISKTGTGEGITISYNIY